MAYARTNLITLGFSDRNLCKRMKGTHSKSLQVANDNVIGHVICRFATLRTMSNACGLVRSEMGLPAAAAAASTQTKEAQHCMAHDKHDMSGKYLFYHWFCRSDGETIEGPIILPTKPKGFVCMKGDCTSCGFKVGIDVEQTMSYAKKVLVCGGFAPYQTLRRACRTESRCTQNPP